MIVAQDGMTVIRWEAADAVKAVWSGGGVDVYAVCNHGTYLCGRYPTISQAAKAIDGMRDAFNEGEDYTFPQAEVSSYRGK